MPARIPPICVSACSSLCAAVVIFCRELSKEPGVDRQIAWQLAAAATSVGSNLEEAKQRTPGRVLRVQKTPLIERDSRGFCQHGCA